MRRDGRDLLTHSRMATFKTCPRKHHYKYNLGIVRDRDSQPLRWGGNWHLGLEWLGRGESLNAIYDGIRKQYADPPAWAVDDMEAWQVEEEQVIRLLGGYAWMWEGTIAEVVATEQQFELAIRNPKTNARTYRFHVAGKIDKIVRLSDGRLAVMEHKSTGDPIGLPDADYWKRTRLDHQVSTYFWAARELGHDVETTVYDAVHKPGIKPKKLTKAQQKEHGIERETIQMYGDRLTEDIGHRPEFYYRREEVPRLQADVDEFLDELWQQQKAIQQAKLYGRHYRNTSACTSPFRCEYLDICHGCGSFDDGIPEGFKQLDYVHPELKEDFHESTTEAAADAGEIKHVSTNRGNGTTETIRVPADAGTAATGR